MSRSRLRERVNVCANKGLGRHEKRHKEGKLELESSERTEGDQPVTKLISVLIWRMIFSPLF